VSFDRAGPAERQRVNSPPSAGFVTVKIGRNHQDGINCRLVNHYPGTKMTLVAGQKQAGFPDRRGRRGGFGRPFFCVRASA
jgi:hypothetical protein